MSKKKRLWFNKREEKLMEWCWDCESVVERVWFPARKTRISNNMHAVSQCVSQLLNRLHAARWQFVCRAVNTLRWWRWWLQRVGDLEMTWNGQVAPRPPRMPFDYRCELHSSPAISLSSPGWLPDWYSYLNPKWVGFLWCFQWRCWGGWLRISGTMHFSIFMSNLM